jgi:FemAB-related protein (PEP-CTERM system-associated)
MNAEHLTPPLWRAWDDFVYNHPRATFFHLTGWRELVEKVWHYTPVYLLARQGRDIQGILPLFLVRSWPGGKRLISVPFAVAGGVCANDKETENLLVNEAIRITQQNNLGYLELRQIEATAMDLPFHTKYTTCYLDLTQGMEAIMKDLRKSLRRCVKKALDSEFEIDFECRDIRELFQVYARAQRRFGTPVQGWKWIQALYQRFPENHAIVRVKAGTETAALALIRRFKDTVYGVIGSERPEYRSMNPFHFLNWRVMEDALQKGYKRFDFGRSLKDSGPYFHKLGWGVTPVAMHYTYYLRNNRPMPDHSQSSPRRKRFARVWRCLPLSVANTLGPVIRKRFP